MFNSTNKHIVVALTLMPLNAAADEATTGRWDDTINNAAFVKEGLQRLYNPHYQYESIGLGGTTLRVGHDGFTRSAAPRILTGGYLEHVPYLAYEYWWDEEGHRYIPFELWGGYGDDLEPGQITSFRHHLDIQAGLMTIDMDLRADRVWQGLHVMGKNVFHTRREIFVTPDGVLVIRVTDSRESTMPFQIRVEVEQDVRIYLNLGIYDKEHPKWTRAVALEDSGAVVVARRPKTCTATLAVAVAGQGLFVDAEKGVFGSTQSGQTLTFYIAPGSSYEGPKATKAAWTKAEGARRRGYDALRVETAQWWKEFYGKSSVRLPDPSLAKWYARSIYYHGVFFGNTDIPPGRNSSSVESFAGAIGLEFDLAFSQFALLYTNHLAESGGVVSWLARVLPRAEQYARKGLILHKTNVKYAGGAKYSTLMGYDGTATAPPSEAEGASAYLNYAGANAAAMALAHTDWAMDGEYDRIADRILKGTTQVSLEDLEWQEDIDGFLSKSVISAVQQSGAIFGLRESFARGVAPRSWRSRKDKILLPTADFAGSKVISVGPGVVPFEGSGDASWLQGLWWYGIISGDSPLARTTYDMISKSLTGNYVFNNSRMGVYAAKLRDGDDSYAWAKRMIRPGVTLFDDTCFGEIVHGPEDFKKTPGIAAHSALICNVTQMLLDADDEDTIIVFPAIPETWHNEGVAFADLAGRGGIRVSAEFAEAGVRVRLRNASRHIVARQLRVRLPGGTVELAKAPEDTRISEGWASIARVVIPAEATLEFVFTPTAGG